MITRFYLERFKSFQQAELALDAFTLLVGTNASGKSNLRDAFRFLHGIGRGYTLAEIIGGAYLNGVEVWTGIRGGARELTFQGMPTFVLEVDFTLPVVQHAATQPVALSLSLRYHTEVQPGTPGETPRVLAESLALMSDDAPPIREEAHGPDFRIGHLVSALLHTYATTTETSIPPAWTGANGRATPFADPFGSMRFLDLDLTAMRQPAQPGQSVLNDKGANLSAVLHHLCQEPQRKQTILSWVRALTGLSIHELEFPTDQIGRVLAMLVEDSGQRFSAYSASDGTLRLLAMLAALLAPEPARFFFFEELENGIHPTQLHLVLDLLERIASQQAIQILATTHSPQSLRFISPNGLEHIFLTYRLEDHVETRLHRLLDLPHAREVIQQQDIAHLYESHWFEDSAAFLAETQEEADANVEEESDA
jgi:predicted ATPase